MARTLNRLSDRRVRTAKSGMHCDGGGLYLQATNFPSEVAELALAHAVGDKVEQAYRRGDQLAKRRRLMEAWSEFCTVGAATGSVVPLRAG